MQKPIAIDPPAAYQRRVADAASATHAVALRELLRLRLENDEQLFDFTDTLDNLPLTPWQLAHALTQETGSLRDWLRNVEGRVFQEDQSHAE